jgi:hypothetical protein
MTIRLLWLFGPWEKKNCQWILDFVVWSTPLGVGHPSTNIQVLQTTHNNGTLYLYNDCSFHHNLVDQQHYT